jgi:hypothetical protein
MIDLASPWFVLVSIQPFPNHLIMSGPDDGYSRNASCTLNLVSRFFIMMYGHIYPWSFFVFVVYTLYIYTIAITDSTQLLCVCMRLFAHSDVQHIMCCVFAFPFFVLGILCCQFIWIVFAFLFFVLGILCCQFIWIVFAFLFFVLGILCCQFIWIVIAFLFFVLGILCCQFIWIVFAFLFFVLCILCCQFIWIVHIWLPLRYSLRTASRLGSCHVTFHSYLAVQLYARQLNILTNRTTSLGKYSVLIFKDLVGLSLKIWTLK